MTTVQWYSTADGGKYLHCSQVYCMVNHVGEVTSTFPGIVVYMTAGGGRYLHCVPSLEVLDEVA